MQTNDTGADRTGRQGKPEQNEAQEKNQTGLPPSNLSLSLFFLKETNWYEQVDAVYRIEIENKEGKRGCCYTSY